MSLLLTRTLSNGDDSRHASREAGPALFLLFEAGRATGARVPLEGAASLVVGRGGARELGAPGEGSARTVLLADPWLSGQHARLERLVTGWAVEDLGSKNGTWVNGRRERRVLMQDGAILQLGHSLLLFRESGADLLDRPRTVHPELAALLTFRESLAEQLGRLQLTTRANLPVLVLGPSGSGKERVAHAVHVLSGRPGDWVPVNCGALPEALVASEMFGSRKGAFSGASADRPGYLMAANGGTLFLDEVAELPMSAQAALLRALQDGHSQMLGTTRQVTVDFQLVCATNADLPRKVAEGTFRQDLLARISGLEVRLPALSERPEDLGLLIRSVLRLRGQEEDAVCFDPEAARALVWHGWPMNLRELDRVLALAVAQADGGKVGREQLPRAIAHATPTSAPDTPGACVEEDQRARLTQSLLRHRGNVAAVARELGKGRMQIHRWLRQYEMDVTRFRP